MSARSKTMTRCTRTLIVLAMTLTGCGGPPAPVEVTEPWTSGDERALGIEEPGAEPAQDGQSPPASASASGSD